MGKKDAKTVLWENVSSLMTHEFGRENMTRFANKCGFAVSTVQRIKEMKTSVGIDVVEQIADAFKIDVQPAHQVTNGTAPLPFGVPD